jgi:hypothetical protein
MDFLNTVINPGFEAYLHDPFNIDEEAKKIDHNFFPPGALTNDQLKLIKTFYYSTRLPHW